MLNWLMTTTMTNDILPLMDKALRTTQTFNWWAQHGPLVDGAKYRQCSALERRINYVSTAKK